MDDDEDWEAMIQRELEAALALPTAGEVEAADEITFLECCRIILEGWALRQNSASPRIQSYNRQVLSLLLKEFGIDWRDDWTTREARARGLSPVLPCLPERFAALADPYESFIEYSPVPGEAQLRLQHKGRLHERKQALRDAWVELFRDLMLLRWPEAAERRTSWTCLKTLGLSDPPEDGSLF
jgi:hypothetical protein